ncbi:citrate/2-methylcitrate synthase [Agitococcus lubricus]|uniref:Citrate synthase n=1 Tax=Agitococcus lubricus TaxID=1077255 RepID=A0A2T5IY11_9GAMM|nr:citrate/2-methylcitrate synthase [Agitococcus lubricus]PTQ88855.1 citrate synthase [Agitococcus lubricus]
MTEPVYHSAIWHEEAAPDNPFVAQACYCHGYDVYGDVIQHATWAEYWLLLLTGQQPNKRQAQLLEKLALIFANVGIRDASTRAAMNAGVSGATHAAILMAALGVGSGQYGGSQEVYLLMQRWHHCQQLPVGDWHQQLTAPATIKDTADIWPTIDHIMGFDPHQTQASLPVQQSLQLLSSLSTNAALPYLSQHLQQLENTVGYGLAFTSLAAATCHDLGLTPDQGALLYLILRLPGAAVHALEQQQLGWRKFPFFGKHIHLCDDPAASTGEQRS